MFPNPNAGIFDVKITSFDSKDAIINIFDITGKKIYSDNLKIADKEANKTFNLYIVWTPY